MDETKEEVAQQAQSSEAVLTKAEQFAKEPDKFINIEDLVVGVLKTEKGMATFIGSHTRVDYEVALARLQHKLFQTFNFMDMEFAKKSQEKKIVTGPDLGGGIQGMKRFLNGR